MPRRQPRHHEQPHPPRHRHIHHRRIIQPPVRMGHLLRTHAHTLIGDIQQHPATVQQMPRHRHRRLRRRKRRRVLHQLRQQVHHIVDRLPAHRDPRLHVQRHPLILLNLRHRRPQHIHQPHRLSPPPRHLMPRQHQQVLTVTPHPRRQMVHLEQIRQPLAVLLPLLQIINQPDLPLHQRLRPPRQVHKHRVHIPAQRRLVRRQPHRLPVHLIKRPRHLTNLIRGIHVDRHHVQQRPRAFPLALTHPAHRLRQPHSGDLQRTGPQPPQRPHHRPGHYDGEEQRESQDEEDDHAGDDGGGNRLVAQRRRARGDLVSAWVWSPARVPLMVCRLIACDSSFGAR